MDFSFNQKYDLYRKYAHNDFSRQRLDGPDNVVSFDRGTPEFEAIMGLFEYVSFSLFLFSNLT